MNIVEFLAPEMVIAHLPVTSKKQALQELARRAGEITGIGAREILDALIERERLGTTGIGNGIAIPHSKLAGLESMCGLFARLEKPVGFDAIDDEPVDLIFLLLAPEGAGAEHLKALARVSRLMRDGEICAKLRGSRDAGALYALLTQRAEAPAA